MSSRYVRINKQASLHHPHQHTDPDHLFVPHPLPTPPPPTGLRKPLPMHPSPLGSLLPHPSPGILRRRHNRRLRYRTPRRALYATRPRQARPASRRPLKRGCGKGQQERAGEREWKREGRGVVESAGRTACNVECGAYGVGGWRGGGQGIEEPGEPLEVDGAEEYCG